MSYRNRLELKKNESSDILYVRADYSDDHDEATYYIHGEYFGKIKHSRYDFDLFIKGNPSTGPVASYETFKDAEKDLKAIISGNLKGKDFDDVRDDWKRFAIGNPGSKVIINSKDESKQITKENKTMKIKMNEGCGSKKSAKKPARKPRKLKESNKPSEDLLKKYREELVNGFKKDFKEVIAPGYFDDYGNEGLGKGTISTLFRMIDQGKSLDEIDEYFDGEFIPSEDILNYLQDEGKEILERAEADDFCVETNIDVFPDDVINFWDDEEYD